MSLIVIARLRQQAGLDGLEAGMGQQPAAAPRAEGGEGLLGVCAKQRVVAVPQPAQQRMARHGQRGPVDFIARLGGGEPVADVQRRDALIHRVLPEHGGGVGVERIVEDPARRRIGAVARRQSGKARVERVDGDRVGAFTRGRLAGQRQRGEVAQPGGRAPAQAV
ncbi:hypothetical protein D3C81_1445960 [compost metagenome]